MSCTLIECVITYYDVIFCRVFDIFQSLLNDIVSRSIYVVCLQYKIRDEFFHSFSPYAVRWFWIKTNNCLLSLVMCSLA